MVATIYPDTASDKTIIWKSSEDSVATIFDEGLVIGITVGEAVITAICGGVSTTCKVTVKKEDKVSVETVLSDLGTSFSVYSPTGILIRKDCSAENLQTLPKGIYIMVSENKRFKIII